MSFSWENSFFSHSKPIFLYHQQKNTVTGNNEFSLGKLIFFSFFLIFPYPQQNGSLSQESFPSENSFFSHFVLIPNSVFSHPLPNGRMSKENIVFVWENCFFLFFFVLKTHHDCAKSQSNLTQKNLAFRFSPTISLRANSFSYAAEVSGNRHSRKGRLPC